MFLPKGAVKYTCLCGAEYLIAFEAEEQSGEWLEVVREAATQLGVEAIDGTKPSFVCSRCGRVHERHWTADNGPPKKQ
jgi:hypothetical protein